MIKRSNTLLGPRDGVTPNPQNLPPAGSRRVCSHALSCQDALPALPVVHAARARPPGNPARGSRGARDSGPGRPERRRQSGDVRGPEVPFRRSAPRRPRHGLCRRAPAAAHVLPRRHRRRRVEDDDCGSWVPVSDGQIETGSIGSIDVADSNPNTCRSGTGQRGHPQQRHHRPRRLQVDRCRQDLAVDGPAGRRADWRSSSTRPTPTSCGWRRSARRSGPPTNAASSRPPTAARRGRGRCS